MRQYTSFIWFERTEHTWRSWLDGLRMPALARPHVARSALTLRALCHEQSGAILAAAGRHQHRGGHQVGPGQHQLLGDVRAH